MWKAKTIYKLISKIKRNKTQKEFLLTDIFKIANIENIPVSLTLTNEYEVMGVNNMHQLSIAEEQFQTKLRKNL